ncbi:MAG TPA: ATP-binding cassette domain-containing protein [Candidatus Binataceae bacterium]|jgi:simple sugar transport system ATP-binding protein|nr:ATP-binding cassette domain-containing protein [Candidatus Binataceae bacterium]
MEGLLKATAITRRFGATTALDGVDFVAWPGEIHALLGENGAGKTTLMNVIAGHLRPDRGTVSLDGVLLKAGSPQAALRTGIATVHQSPMLFENLSVVENLALGGFVRRGLALDEVAARAAAMATRLGFRLRLEQTTLRGLSIAERMRLEILRALSFDPRVLILDEPTGLLAPTELSGFLDLLRGLRERGRIVVLITHKLAEAMAVADRITMLRGGRVVGETSPARTSAEQLAGLMIGAVPPPPPERARGLRRTEVLTADGLALEVEDRQVLEGICLRLRTGEILAIGGVDGNGQLELTEILAGARRPSRGRITLHGKPVDADTDCRIAVIPQSRDQEGLILDMELWENLLLAPAIRREMDRSGLQDRRGAIALCSRLIDRFGIRASGPRQKAAALSGGHRQRLMVARALAAHPEVLVAHDLARGLDVAATAEVHRMVREFAAAGGAVLLISTDLDEIFGLGDRVAVISRGRLFEVADDRRTPEQVGLLMAGANV